MNTNKMKMNGKSDNRNNRTADFDIQKADRDKDGVKEYRCTAITSSGNRCKNKGEYTGKKKLCYAHR